MERKLNLGCGKLHKEGYVNLDIVNPADVVADVREPLPFKDNNFDRIEADNLMEHMGDEFLGLMNECYRVMKPGGVLWIKVPNARDWFDGAAGDPTHKRFFTPRTFGYLTIGDAHYERYGSTYGFRGWNGVTLDVTKQFIEWEGKK